MSGIRAQQKASTKARILAAARAHFAKQAYDDVGVRDIAQSAGVAAGTIIASFGSKADLLNALLIENLNAHVDLATKAAEGIDNVLDRFVAMARSVFDYQIGQIGLMRATIANSWVRSFDAESEARAATIPVLKLFRENLVLGVEKGHVRADADLKLASLMIYESLINTCRMAAYEDATPLEMQRTVALRLTLLLRGLLREGVDIKAMNDGSRAVA